MCIQISYKVIFHQIIIPKILQDPQLGRAQPYSSKVHKSSYEQRKRY
jgi:hypothetical protein